MHFPALSHNVRAHITPTGHPEDDMKTIAKLDTIYDGWSKFQLAHVRLSDGTIIKRQIEDHGRAIVVLPYDVKRRTTILVRQFRPPVYMMTGQQDLLEVIAGIVDEDDIAAAARREAEEEAGLTLTHLEHVGCFFSIPGISTERVDYFLAEYSKKSRTSAGGGLASEHEEIEVIEMPLAELASLADSGALQDVKTFTLIQTLRLKRPELFPAFAEPQKNGDDPAPGKAATTTKPVKTAASAKSASGGKRVQATKATDSSKRKKRET